MRRLLARRSAASIPWAETKAADLHGVQVVGPSPGLAWVHGLGGSCAADDARGVGAVLSPQVLGRTVLRLDLRGHGRSAGAHDPEAGPAQYAWSSLAKDLRLAANASLSRAFFGGEALGAAVALHAAVAATKTGSRDAPPGLVLMRPPAALVQGIAGEGFPADLQRRLLAAAEATEAQGVEAVEALERAEGASLLDGAAAAYSAGDGMEAALLECRRAMPAEAYAAALRGHAASRAPGEELESLGKAQHAMAGDAYGVPLTLQCPVLVLAVPGDADHPVEAAEALAKRLPGAELAVAATLKEAHDNWARQINAFLRKAWMKEFLTKRVMPQ